MSLLNVKKIAVNKSLNIQNTYNPDAHVKEEIKGIQLDKTNLQHSLIV